MTAIGLRGPQTLADIPISAENQAQIHKAQREDNHARKKYNPEDIFMEKEPNEMMDSYLGTPGKAMT